MEIIYSNWLMNNEIKNWLTNALFCKKPFWHNGDTIIYMQLIIKIFKINITVIGNILPFMFETYIFDLSIYH